MSTSSPSSSSGAVRPTLRGLVLRVLLPLLVLALGAHALVAQIAGRLDQPVGAWLLTRDVPVPLLLTGAPVWFVLTLYISGRLRYELDGLARTCETLWGQRLLRGGGATWFFGGVGYALVLATVGADTLTAWVLTADGPGVAGRAGLAHLAGLVWWGTCFFIAVSVTDSARQLACAMRNAAPPTPDAAGSSDADGPADAAGPPV